MKELRIFGPPGTGKTTRLATEEIPKAAKKFGSDRIMVASFSKAAAKAIANKKSRKTGYTIPVPEKNVGTLHSICYRALNSPIIAETKKKEWNEQNPMYPMGILAGSMSLDDGYDEPLTGGRGDELLGKVNIMRSKCVHPNLWSQELKVFYKKWCRFKRQNGYMDFTDLIEEAVNRILIPPNNPRVMFLDEAQDFTPLQLKLIRRWGQHVDWFVLVGDDDQNLYHFTGAEPEAFLNPPVDDKFKRILNQSFRVPRLILEKANNIIARVSIREPKIYMPRKDGGVVVDGLISNLNLNYKQPEKIINHLINKSKKQSIMVLASCSYMIDPIKHELKKRGVPFENQYRRRRADWNPLVPGGDEKVTVRGITIIDGAMNRIN